MKEKKPVDIERMIRESTLVDEAIRLAIQDAMRLHKKLGDPVVGWKDGQVVWVPADQIELDEEPPAQEDADD